MCVHAWCHFPFHDLAGAVSLFVSRLVGHGQQGSLVGTAAAVEDGVEGPAVVAVVAGSSHNAADAVGLKGGVLFYGLGCGCRDSHVPSGCRPRR